MPKTRKDNKGRNLRPGETQRADGSYMYVYNTYMTLILPVFVSKKSKLTKIRMRVSVPRKQ